MYWGVLVNTGLVIAGGTIGLVFKSNRLKTIGDRVLQLYALFIIAMGVNGAAEITHPIIVSVSIIIGVAIGELLDIDAAFNKLGKFLENKFAKNKETESTFREAFVNSIFIFCIGSMTFLGAIGSALNSDHSVFITKAILDFVTAISLSMGLGLGVVVSAAGVLLYEGFLVTIMSFIQPIMTESAITLSATVGSLILIGIGTNMLGMTKIKVANFIPAMFIPMIMQLIPSLSI